MYYIVCDWCPLPVRLSHLLQLSLDHSIQTQHPLLTVLQDKNAPDQGPLHLLCFLLKTFILQVEAWLSLLPGSGLCSKVNILLRPSLIILFKIALSLLQDHVLKIHNMLVICLLHVYNLFCLLNINEVKLLLQRVVIFICFFSYCHLEFIRLLDTLHVPIEHDYETPGNLSKMHIRIQQIWLRNIIQNSAEDTLSNKSPQQYMSRCKG